MNKRKNNLGIPAGPIEGRNDGNAWDQLETDTFLNLYWDGCGIITIAQKLGRDPYRNGIGTKLWKLATNYDGYEPGPTRKPRQGAFTKREKDLIARAVNRGDGHEEITPKYIAGVLGREVEDVEQFFTKKEDKGFGF